MAYQKEKTVEKSKNITTKVIMLSEKKPKNIEIKYEYVPDNQSSQKLITVYAILFDEIKEIIAKEKS